jgi:hypothetical protein
MRGFGVTVWGGWERQLWIDDRLWDWEVWRRGY